MAIKANKLVILGMLRNQEVHGYILCEQLEHTPGLPVRVKKANTYKLLGIMEEDGWVDFREEKVGKRPTRRVYWITPEGQEAFVRLVQESLAEYTPPEFPHLVPMSYLEALPRREVVAYLQDRIDEVSAKVAEFEQLPSQTFEMYPSLDLRFQFHKTELAWLEKLQTRARTKKHWG